MSSPNSKFKKLLIWLDYLVLFFQKRRGYAQIVWRFKKVDNEGFGVVVEEEQNEQ